MRNYWNLISDISMKIRLIISILYTSFKCLTFAFFYDFPMGKYLTFLVLFSIKTNSHLPLFTPPHLSATVVILSFSHQLPSYSFSIYFLACRHSASISRLFSGGCLFFSPYLFVLSTFPVFLLWLWVSLTDGYIF